MIDPHPPPGPAWSGIRTSVELLLGLSFCATVAFGGYAAATGRTAVLAQGSGIVFLVTLTCVLVSWFRAVETDDPTRDRGPVRAPDDRVRSR